MSRTVINFEDLSPGVRVADQYADQGVTIFSLDPESPATLLDSSRPLPRFSDFQSDTLGNVLVASNAKNPANQAPDNQSAILGFRFDSPSAVESLTVLDIDDGGNILLYDENGRQIGDIPISTADGEQQDVAIGVSDVSYMVVAIRGTGAVDNLVFDPVTPAVDGYVDGTDGDDLIAPGYVDADGDRIDGGDAPGGTAGAVGSDEDSVRAGTGDDTVRAGEGDDSIDGGSGNDSLEGQAGDDVIQGGTGSDTIRGNQGNDAIISGPIGTPDLGYPGRYRGDSDPNDDRDFVSGGQGDDVIFTGDDADTVVGGAGRDTIDGGYDNDSLSGGDDDDFVVGGEGSDSITGDAGNDRLYGDLGPILYEENDPRRFDGQPDNGRDTIDGGAGNDTIFGQDDADRLIGGEGNDLIGGGVDDDTIFGDAGDDTLKGGQGDDLLYGGDGNDVLRGGRDDAGSDTLYGGDGDDTLSPEDGDDLVFGGAGNDLIDNGATFNGRDRGVDTIYGGDDRDTIIGASAGDFIDGGEGGDDFDILDLRGSNVRSVTYTSDDLEDGYILFRDGGRADFEEIENVIPCFTPNTLIATARGEVPVESIAVGDRVITRDNGIQPVRWVGRRDLTEAQIATSPSMAAVTIRKGALGHGLPERDMAVSPQHRVLISSDEAMLYFDEREVLVAAKHLVGRPGIEHGRACDTSYIHFMFDNHEIVLSDGAWTESFQPGDHSLKGIGKAQRDEILALFPELRHPDGRAAYTAARRMLRRREVELLTP